MTFLLDDEQHEFGRTLDRMLSAADVAGAVRAWGADDTGPGRKVWQRLADAGVFALAVPEEYGGAAPDGHKGAPQDGRCGEAPVGNDGAAPEGYRASGLLPLLTVEMSLAFVVLGCHAMPGPVVETVAAAALLRRLDDPALNRRWLPGIATGGHLVSYTDQAHGPYALDAAAADTRFVIMDDRLLCAAGHGPVQPSLDPARRLARPALDDEVLASGPEVRAAAAHAADVAALLTAAQALGVGRRLLADTITYVQQRKQFGVAIGSFQAVKHRLADALLALEFAQPLVFAAAVALAGGERRAHGERRTRGDVAAAKVAAGEAAYGAARTALQLHGAVGYTEELDLSLWIRKARALRSAWGTPSACRARVLAGAP
ncbi:acyl-CoA dehydrogenase family protein [Streptomyces halobius]|uniref:Acyl-CoA/acyl-ACP dehydrogenase n=1 Tax=Streptomyces halobius TaxID=2879846 RepID=A0ABY4M3N0_9ACTN|nr:acyl-CoA dehydrogenase family protein [Streptomyces halobius]UQA91848.1 acyl-CoA/acyl-ACP dehydrogenase [Streptomyces halobius]